MNGRRNLIRKIFVALQLHKALQFVWQSDKRLMVSSLILLAFQSLLPLAGLYMLKIIIDRITEVVSLGGDPTIYLNEIIFLFVIAGGFTLSVGIVRTLSTHVREYQGLVVTDYMYDLLHHKSIEVDFEYYENPEYFDKLHRAQEEASFRPMNLLYNLLTTLQSGLSLLVLSGLLLSLNPLVALLLFVSVLPGLVVRLRYADQMYFWQRKRTETERHAKYYDMMLTDNLHAKEVRLFNLGDLFLGRFHGLRNQLRGERMEIVRRRTKSTMMTIFFVIALEFGAYVFIAYAVLNQNISIGEFVLYIEAFRMGQDAISTLLYSIADLYEDNLFLRNLYEFLDLEPTISKAENPLPIPAKLQTGLQIEGLHFKYPTAARKALHDINLTIKPGEIIALVGENGSGKTTLIKLLCRLYDPTEGSITLDGANLGDYDIDELRGQIGVLFQDYVHYNLSVKENIWFGKISDDPEQEKIIDAATRSGISRVVERLPYDYETILGKWFDEGEELSIGEWQKLALSRAYLRDAPLIILDEPTSAMDARAEHEVFANFRQLIDGKTAIIISHRLSTVKMADCIYLLDKGCIVESGSHEELMALNGKYSQLFNMQAQYYD